jgi:hypothetical protein
MDGVKPLVLTFIVWVAAQLTSNPAPTEGVVKPIEMIFGVISSALVLALLGAGVKFGRIQAKLETLTEEVDRLRKRLDK